MYEFVMHFNFQSTFVTQTNDMQLINDTGARNTRTFLQAEYERSTSEKLHLMKWEGNEVIAPLYKGEQPEDHLTDVDR